MVVPEGVDLRLGQLGLPARDEGNSHPLILRYVDDTRMLDRYDGVGACELRGQLETVRQTTDSFNDTTLNVALGRLLGDLASG